MAQLSSSRQNALIKQTNSHFFRRRRRNFLWSSSKLEIETETSLFSLVLRSHSISFIIPLGLKKREREREMGSTSTLQGWRKAYGALKDTTKVGLAHVNSDYAVFSSPCHFLNTNKHTHTFILLFFFHCFSKYYLIRSSYLSIGSY